MAKSSKQIKKISYKENPVYNYILLGSFAVFLAVFTTFKISGDDDVFWHLTTGKYVVENHTVPKTDIFGYMTQGNPWMPFEWGWDVLTYSIYSFSGFYGLSVLRTLIFFLIFGIYFLIFRKFKVSYPLIFFFFAIQLLAIIDRLTPRPHLVSYLFFVSLLYIILQYRYFNRTNYKLLYYIPIIFLIWANMHMGIIAGIFLFGLYVFSEIVQTYLLKNNKNKEIRNLNNKEIARLIIIYGVSVAVMFINPNGFETYIYAFEHTKMKMLETVNEWRSPYDSTYSDNLVTNLYKLFLYSGIFVLIYSFIKKDYFPSIMFAGFALYSVRAMRFTVDYDIIMFVFIVISVNLVINKIKSEDFKAFLFKMPYLKLGLAALFLYLLIPVNSNSFYLETLKYYRITGFGINSDFIPTQLFNFMKENSIPDKGTKVFNHFGTGGFFIWNFPDKQNFIDSRNLNDSIFNKYNQIISKMPGFERKISEYGIDYAIYLAPDLVRQPKEMETTVISYFCKSPDWKLIFWDDKSFLWVKNDSKFTDLISKFEYKYFNPYNLMYQKNVMDNAFINDKEIILKEYQRKQNEEPNGVITYSFKEHYKNKLNN